MDQRLIVLVESDRASRQRLSSVLRRRGFLVIAVRSNRRAIIVLKHERPSVVLADPDASNHDDDLIERIRSSDAKLPIILLHRNGDTTARAYPAGEVQASLSTDVSEDRLVQEVERWLNAPPPRARGERWPGSILVADDEPKLRQILEEFLHLHGFTVLTAASGHEALERFLSHAPTVVLLDIRMPGMDGIETLRQMKAAQPDAVVIMMTGLEEEGLMTQALALGAYDYVIKPFDWTYLESTLLSRIILGPGP